MLHAAIKMQLANTLTRSTYVEHGEKGLSLKDTQGHNASYDGEGENAQLLPQLVHLDLQRGLALLNVFHLLKGFAEFLSGGGEWDVRDVAEDGASFN